MSPGAAAFVVALAVLVPAAVGTAATELWPHAMDRVWTAVANAVTFGWYRRLQPQPPQPRCVHLGAVAVEDLSGETVAHLCTHCDEQLPAKWKPSFIDAFFDPHLLGER